MLFIRLPGELSDAAMESGEIRKNTRLNIYSDEEAQVRHIMTPYFLLVLGFPCVFCLQISMRLSTGFCVFAREKSLVDEFPSIRIINIKED